MKKTAIIPLRKGSKGIPGKNKKKMLGRPLFCWGLTEAIFSDLDEVYVYTDDQDIITFVQREYQWTPKVKALLRSEKNADDKASTESVMIEFAEAIKYDFDVLCLLQATSLLTTSTDINKVLNKVMQDYDSALTVVKTHRFVWNEDGTPQNYDMFNRPRRQDFEGLLIENGAVYATTKEAFQKSNNRLSGSIGLVEMPEDTLIEIDSISDWQMAENLLVNRLIRGKKQQKIQYLVLDVDGVFTDGGIYFDSEGEMAKKFDMRDGMGLEILRENGVEVVVVTSENSAIVKQRMKKLKIENAFFEIKDKYALLKHFIFQKNVDISEMAYVGDDVNDLSNICSVGWSFAPANAMDIVKKHADIVLTKSGGEGAIREVCEIIMKYNKRY